MKLRLALSIILVLPFFSFKTSALENEMIGDATLQALPDCSKSRIKSMLTQLNRAEKAIKKLLKKEQIPAFVEDAFKATDQDPRIGLELQKRYAKSHYVNRTSEMLDLLISPLQQDSTPTAENQRQLATLLAAMALPFQQIISDRDHDSQKNNYERRIVYNAALNAVAEMEMQNISGLKDLISHACDQADSEQEGQDDL